MDDLFNLDEEVKQIENKCEFDFAFDIDNSTVQESIPRTANEIKQYDRIACCVSGGSDSDDMIDIVSSLDPNKKIKYVWFDTGIEMKATKNHLDYLENRYGINIERAKPKYSVGAAVRHVGYPFLSKQISEYISRLQKHNFKWEDKPFDELYAEYPKCKIALKWWCNQWDKGSNFNIERNIYLKEFMVQNPPDFKISKNCCDLSKKSVGDKFRKENDIQIQFIGVRKAEGGARASAYKSCMSEGVHGLLHFPLFWFKDYDKEVYESARNIVHSDAYTVYGCKRTGCAGCPLNGKFEEELAMLEQYEPMLAKGVKKIFEPSYEYTRKYKAFKERMKLEKKEEKFGHQLTFSELL